MSTTEKPKGKTKDAGWQFGLRKTLPYAPHDLWDFMFSDKGLRIWLGELENELELDKSFRTKNGTVGTVTVIKPYSHVRMQWRKESWDSMSTLQVRVIGDGEKSTLSFHQEKLLGEAQREEVKLYWNEKMKAIEEALASEK